MARDIGQQVPDVSEVQLEQIPLPSKVFAISGEALAFQAKVKSKQKQKVTLPLSHLKCHVGGFKHVIVFELDKEGKVLSRQNAEVELGGSITLSATVGYRYLIYADLGERYRNTYNLLCRLRRIQIAAKLMPRICTEILCSSYAFPASNLLNWVPELREYAGALDLKDGLVGGFGGTGGICEVCFGHALGDRDTFYPGEDCELHVPNDLLPCPSSEQIVYSRQAFPTDETSGPSQIYKSNSDGSNPVNLSNNAYYDVSPDVSHDGASIVFASWRGGSDVIHVMDINGSNVTSVPNTQSASYPKWSRHPDWFIVFAAPTASGNSAIFSIRPDGSDRRQITTPGPNESDEYADVIDDKHIVFSRFDRTNNNRDLYLKYIWDSRPMVRLTNTGNLAEGLPVVAHHNDGKIAYRTFSASAPHDHIVIAQLNNMSSISVLSTISLALPAEVNISGIDFSKDDSCIYFSAQVNDVCGSLINRKQELFSVRLDGTNQHRLTVNTDSDTYPSSVPA